jgi:hypothetical protein
MKRSGSITALDLSNRNAAHKALTRTHRNAPLRSAATLDRAHFLEPLEPRVFMSASATVSQLLDQTGGTTSADALLTTPRRTAARLIDSPTGTLVAQTGAPAPAATDSTSSSTSGGTTSGSTVTGTTGGTSSNTISAVATSTGSSTPTRQPVLSPSKPRSSADYRYILRPGSGFTGPSSPDPLITTQDQTKAGWDEKAIARWDVVPYQTFTDTFNVGVVAFHMNGIKEVAFSVNGGDWTHVKSMSVNPQTANHSGVGNPSDGVVEYWATLRAADFADGQIEIRAIAYPNNGVPRVLQGATASTIGEESLLLSSNASQTLSQAVRYVSPTGNDANDGLTAQTPKKDPAKAIISAASTGNVDGVVLYLMSGVNIWSSPTYPLNTTTNTRRWVTITNAPGTTRDQVHLQGAGGTSAVCNAGSMKLIQIKNITLDAVTGIAAIYDSGSARHMWFNGVVVDGIDRSLPGARNFFAMGSTHMYLTDSTVRNLADATGPGFVRNSSVAGILSDAYSGAALVINSTVTDINPLDSGSHPDISQYVIADYTNVIIYGLKSDHNFAYPNGVQGLSLSTHQFTDFAVVNSDYYTRPSWSTSFAISGNCTNLYIKDSSFEGASANFYTFTAVDVVIENTSFSVTPPIKVGVLYR